MKLLFSFSRDEMKKFEYFIQSKYFNTDKIVVELYFFAKKHIKKSGDDFQLNDELKLQLYKHILPKESHITQLNNQQKNYLSAKISLLNTALKHFIAVEALKEDKAFEYILLHRKLLEKQAFDTLEKSIKKQRKTLNETSIQGSRYYFEEAHAEMTTLNFLYQNGRIGKQNNLSELILSFDTYYLIQQLNWHLTALSMMRTSAKIVYDFERFELISQLTQLPQYVENPLIQIYQCAIDMIQHNSHEAYDNLLKLLQDHKAVIPRNDLVDFYKSATSFCARRIKEGQEAYNAKRFETHKIMEREGLLMLDNFMPITLFKNIISAGCYVKEFEWTLYVLNKYKPFVRASIRQQVYHFNRAVIEFHQRNYRQTLHHCIRVHRVSTAYDINCRIIELKAHYELDEEYSEYTMQRFDTIKQTVRSHKGLSPQDKKAWSNFLYTAKGLYKVKHCIGKTKAERLATKLENFKNINDKRWLLEKMDEV